MCAWLGAGSLVPCLARENPHETCEIQVGCRDRSRSWEVWALFAEDGLARQEPATKTLQAAEAVAATSREGERRLMIFGGQHPIALFSQSLQLLGVVWPFFHKMRLFSGFPRPRCRRYSPRDVCGPCKTGRPGTLGTENSVGPLGMTFN